MKLSVLVPARDEAATLAAIVARVRATRLVHEIIVVDDGSTDPTPALLKTLAAGDPPLMSLRHPVGRGKGAAIRTALAAATGDVVLVQDADLEYDPADYAALLAPFFDPAVQAVYGSRNLRAGNGRSTFAFYWGGRGLSWLANLLYDAQLTDVTTGYKAVRTPLLRSLGLASDGFEFCPELTARLRRRGVVIHEVPISYRPRSRAEGKKIRVRDGLIAIQTLIRLRFGRLRQPGR